MFNLTRNRVFAPLFPDMENRSKSRLLPRRSYIVQSEVGRSERGKLPEIGTGPRKYIATGTEGSSEQSLQVARKIVSSSCE